MSLQALFPVSRTQAPNSSEKTRQRPISGLAGAFLAAAILAGCGGGGGGGGGGAGFPVAATPTKAADPVKAPEPVAEPAPPPSTPCRIVLYGDSIMRGEPLIGEGPARRMARMRPAWSLDLRAVAGQTGSDGAVEFLHQPREGFDVAAVQWGYNDMIRMRDVEPVAPFVRQLQSEGLRVVLTGLVANGGTLHTLYDNKLRQIATDAGAGWADWTTIPILTLDSVHPVQESSDRLTDRLIAALDSACAK